ncbi:MAG: hypothetical protein V3V00_10975 [Saprospiraceae bacterium]
MPKELLKSITPSPDSDSPVTNSGKGDDITFDIIAEESLGNFSPELRNIKNPKTTKLTIPIRRYRSIYLWFYIGNCIFVTIQVGSNLVKKISFPVILCLLSLNSKAPS